MNFELIKKMVEQGKLDTDKSFCSDCCVNLIEREVESDNGTTIYQECPTCHKKWTIDYDKEGFMVSVNMTESR